MLTRLWLGNFIHFKEEQVFKFNKGLNILLGPNHTGKTSVFEATRRCMSVKLNGGLSNPHDADKMSYVTSTFENNNGGESTVVTSSIIRTKVNEVGNKLVTLKFVKLTYLNDNGEETATDTAIDAVDIYNKDLVNEQLPTEGFDFTALSEEDPSKLENAVNQYLANADVKRQLQQFFSVSRQQQRSISLFQQGKTETASEGILQKHVDEEAVIIFPFRSFATHQWTRSKRDMKDVAMAGDNYDEITLKKEIICWYLRKDNTEETKLLEEKYFDLITGNSLFRFKLVNERVQVYVGNSSTKETLLKVPEGIYEAKSAAIVLADPQFQTICLDDAERGMHPQMIERFRDLVLQDIDDKVVLVITHHPTFLAPWNIAKTFFFQRRADDDGYQFSVKPLERYAEQIGGKGPQIITSGQFPSLFFAERICWVEGKTEYLFMTAMKYVLVRKNSTVLESYCSGDEEKKKRFRDFLSTLHIVSMDGEAGKCFFREISQSLDLTHYFILDFDALKNNLKKPTKQATGALKRPPSECDVKQLASKDVFETFGNAFGVKLDIDQIESIKTTNDIVDELQRHGIFVWKLTDEDNHSSGTIENAVDRMRNKYPELQSFLDEKKMTLKKKRKRKNTDGEDKVEKFGRDMGMGKEDILALKSFLQDKNIVQKTEKAKCNEAENKFEKLFKDTSIKNDDITDVVERLLNPGRDGGSTNIASADYQNDDFHRLVTFLIERCSPATDGPASKKRRAEQSTAEGTAEPVVGEMVTVYRR